MTATRSERLPASCLMASRRAFRIGSRNGGPASDRSPAVFTPFSPILPGRMSSPMLVQQCFDSELELRDTNRFVKIGVRSGTPHFGLQGGVAERRHDDDWAMGSDLPEPADVLWPAGRHAEISENEIRH